MLTPSLLAAPRLPANPIPEGCPWHELSKYGLPNVNWCEDFVCSWINEPALTWSNLAYLLAALWIVIVESKKDGGLPQGPLRWFAPVLATVGLCSGIYHASNVQVTQVLDFFGMYLFCFLLLSVNAVRLRVLSLARLPLWFIALTLLTTAGTAVAVRLGFPIQSIVAVLTLALVLSELLLRRQSQAAGQTPAPLRYFLSSLAVLTLAAISSGLDVSRTLCDPQNHFLQGHAVWHVLSALSLLFAFYHFRQFRPVLQAR